MSVSILIGMINTVTATENIGAVYENYNSLAVGQLDVLPENFTGVNDNPAPEYYAENGKFGKSAMDELGYLDD